MTRLPITNNEFDVAWLVAKSRLTQLNLINIAFVIEQHVKELRQDLANSEALAEHAYIGGMGTAASRSGLSFEEWKKRWLALSEKPKPTFQR